MTILALAVLTPLFVIIPYFANIWAALHMYQRIEHNIVARLYFEQRMVFFCSLVLLSGGVHASTQLVSSRIFGVSLFDCGLSKRELSQFTGMRLTFSVLLENLPQLILQIIYVITAGGINAVVGVAMFTSIFSASVAAFAHFFRTQMDLSEVIVPLVVDIHNAPLIAAWQEVELNLDIPELEQKRDLEKCHQRRRLRKRLTFAIGI